MPRHAWVWISEAGLQVEDLGGGTRVNGYPISEWVQVEYPASVQAGDVTLVVEVKAVQPVVVPPTPSSMDITIPQRAVTKSKVSLEVTIPQRTPTRGNVQKTASTWTPSSHFSALRDDTAREFRKRGQKRFLALPTHRAFPLFVHRWNAHRAERLFVSTLIPIQTLAQRCGVEPVNLHPFAAFIPVLGLYHVVLDAEFLHSTAQMEPECTRFITGHHVTGELLLFHQTI